MQYTFYYKVKSGVEHISYTSFDEETLKEGYGKIGNIQKLIDFIKRNCVGYMSASFNDFDNDKIAYILNSISEEVEYYPTINNNTFDLFKRQTKKRGK